LLAEFIHAIKLERSTYYSNTWKGDRSKSEKFGVMSLINEEFKTYSKVIIVTLKMPCSSQSF
jgi:hypothetical protein